MKSVKFIFVISLILILGCTKAPSSNSNGGSTDAIPESASVRCGVFTADKFEPSVPFDNAEAVYVEALGADLVSITRTTGEEAGNKQLVKLQGITASGLSSGKLVRAKQTIDAEVGFGALFLPAGDSCTLSLPSGGKGVYGQIFTADHRSLSEILVSKGLAFPEAGVCGGDELAGCYAGIEAQEEISDQVLTHFLWKPVSESNGKLVILHDGFGVNVSIEGAVSSMAGTDDGGSNGYAATIRYPYPGCAYGSPTLRFYDQLDRVVALNNGQTSLKISNGCERTELKF